MDGNNLTQAYYDGTIGSIPPPTRENSTDKDLNERLEFTADERASMRNPTFGVGATAIQSSVNQSGHQHMAAETH